MRALAIMLTCMFAAVLYGICANQVAARISIEFFTLLLPPIFGPEDPTLLGIGWGIVATWWVGLLMGGALALAARAGSWPKRSPESMLLPIGSITLITAAGAALAGLIARVGTANGWVWLLEPFASEVPEDRHADFLVVMWVHNGGYVVAALACVGVIVWVLIWRARRASRIGSPAPPS